MIIEKTYIEREGDELVKALQYLPGKDLAIQSFYSKANKKMKNYNVVIKKGSFDDVLKEVQNLGIEVRGGIKKFDLLFIRCSESNVKIVSGFERVLCVEEDREYQLIKPIDEKI